MDVEEERPPERPAEVTAEGLGDAFYIGCRPLLIAAVSVFAFGFLVWAVVTIIVDATSEDRRIRGFVSVEGPSTTGEPR